MLQTVDGFYIKDPQVLDITGNYYKQLSRNGEGGGEGGGYYLEKNPSLTEVGLFSGTIQLHKPFEKKFKYHKWCKSIIIARAFIVFFVLFIY